MLFTTLILAWFVSGVSILSHAALVNVTIDDTLPDPMTGRTISYQPAEAWNSGADCKRCTARPDPSMVYSRTSHDSTVHNDH